MDNNSSAGFCANYAEFDHVQLSYVINSLVTITLTFPAVILNFIVIAQYLNLSHVAGKRNSKFLIFHQAVADLFNVLVNSPFNAVLNVVYFTNVFPGITMTREASCPYLYIVASWTMVTSLISSLLLFIIVALDRFLSVWKPAFWLSYLKTGQRTKLKVLMIVIWMISFIFSLGEVYAHAVEFFSYSRTKVHANRFHYARMVAGLALLLILLPIWVLNGVKVFVILRNKPSPRDPPKGNTNLNFSADEYEEGRLPETTNTPQHSGNHHNVSKEIQTTENSRNISKHPPGAAITGTELHFVRVFATMLVLFLLGYLPTIVYFILRTINSGSFSKIQSEALVITFATGFTGLTLSSCINPLIVLLRVDPFQLKLTKKTVSRHMKASSRWAKENPSIPL